MLNLFRPYLQYTGGVESMKTLGGMKVPVSFTIILVMQPRRKMRIDWMAGLAILSRSLLV